MKISGVILIIFLAYANILRGQWPVDAGYKTHSTVQDGFGGVWNFDYMSNNIFLIRSSNKYPVLFGASGPDCFNEKLKFEERSLPLEAGINLAFYGYLKALNQYTDGMTVSLKVNPDTGKIDEVGFMVLSPKNGIMLLVPPRCFTLYEDILKKTVMFKPLHGIFDLANTKGDGEIYPRYGVCYIFDVNFPTPANGEPNFLQLPIYKYFNRVLKPLAHEKISYDPHNIPCERHFDVGARSSVGFTWR